MDGMKERILELTLASMELEQLASRASEPQRTHYSNKAKITRKAAYEVERKLKALESGMSASA